MILFFGIPSEAPMALAVAAAADSGYAHVSLSQRTSHHMDLMLQASGPEVTGVLVAGGEEFALDMFSAVYARPMDPLTLPDLFSRNGQMWDPRAVERACVFHDILIDWLELASCRVVNRPTAMASNISKPYQAQLLAAVGFKIPPTLITNDPGEAENFARVHRTVVYKSISSVRSVVHLLDAAALRRLDRVKYLPTQFQAYIPGVDVRVHVVGPTVFATEIESEAVDYRYAYTQGLEARLRPTRLPADVEDRCRLGASSLGLDFCGFDLRRHPDGDYHCLEANPMPAYSYYQEHTGQPIAQALVRYLAYAESGE